MEIRMLLLGETFSLAIGPGLEQNLWCGCALHKRLATKDIIMKFGIATDDICCFVEGLSRDICSASVLKRVMLNWLRVIHLPGDWDSEVASTVFDC